MTSESLTPAVGGAGVVARGFGLLVGASEGCAGGPARCRSSRSVYVPVGHGQKLIRSSRSLGHHLRPPLIGIRDLKGDRRYLSFRPLEGPYHW